MIETLPEPGKLAVPLMSPVLVFKVIPAGKDPVSILNVNGEVAPVTFAAQLIGIIVEMFDQL